MQNYDLFDLKTEKTYPAHLDDELSAKETMGLIGLAALAVLLLGVIPFVDLLNYPFRLLVTIVHELGHGLAALLTGGRFISFEVSPGGSGLAYTREGWRFVIIPAGYLSVALFTGLLIMLGRSYRWSRRLMIVLGFMMFILSALFARPGGLNMPQLISGIMTFFVGLIFGSLFIWVAIRATARWMIFLIHFLAIKAGITAFTDLFYIIRASASPLAARSDAHSMAQLTGIPALVWGIVWVVMAFLIVGGAVWLTWVDQD